MKFVLHAPRGCLPPLSWATSSKMAGRETVVPERNQAPAEGRLEALRAELHRDVADADATDALTALIDALDGYQRQKPLRLPTR